MKSFAKLAPLACLLGILAAPAWAADAVSTPATAPEAPVAQPDFFMPEPQQKDGGCTLTCPNGGPVYTCEGGCFVIPDMMLWCMRAEYWCEY
ncbi:MAG TPA: hypothetical protein VEG34_03010 [Thermoanaerobaculia bacterium]|nr:hypothetical protein [Thermoanaerobaculia bacterium]